MLYKNFLLNSTYEIYIGNQIWHKDIDFTFKLCKNRKHRNHVLDENVLKNDYCKDVIMIY